MIQHYRNSIGWFLHHRPDDRFLLQLRDDISTIPEPNRWTFPGGSAEPGVPPRQLARRELKEELDFAPPLMEEVITIYLHAQQKAEHYYYVPLPDNLHGMRFREGVEWRLFSIEEIEGLDLAFWSRELIPILRRYIAEKDY